MAKSKYKQIKAVISLVYIFSGISAVLQTVKGVFEQNWDMLFPLLLGALVLVAGFFGLFSIKPKTCHAFGFVIMLLSTASLVYLIFFKHTFDFEVMNHFLLSWLFMLCV